MRNDPKALIAIRSLGEHVDLKDVLSSLKLPCLFYAGDRDSVHQRSKETAELIPKARFVSLPGLDHMGAYRQSELVLPHVLRFLTNIE